MGSRIQAMDVALDRLDGAHRRAGLPPLRPPAGDLESVLSRIHAEIHPFRLPEEVVHFWRRVDPASIEVAPYPGLTRADFALDCWISHRDELAGSVPRLLFPVAYESHGFLFVELADGHEAGGACIEWGYGGCDFEVWFASLTGYVDLLATMIELGEFHRDGTDGRIRFDPEDRWTDARTVRLTADLPLPRLGHRRQIGEDNQQWPEHWLLSSDIRAEDRVPRGATTSVAELLDLARRGRAAAGTIRGAVVFSAGTAAGRRVRVDDGTGLLDVWCPARVVWHGPGPGGQYEFDVVVRADPPPPRDHGPLRRQVEERALAHDLAGAQEAGARLHEEIFGTEAAAEATAVRPGD